MAGLEAAERRVSRADGFLLCFAGGRNDPVTPGGPLIVRADPLFASSQQQSTWLLHQTADAQTPLSLTCAASSIRQDHMCIVTILLFACAAPASSYPGCSRSPGGWHRVPSAHPPRCITSCVCSRRPDVGDCPRISANMKQSRPLALHYR